MSKPTKSNVSNQCLKDARQGVKKALPKGWKARVHPYCDTLRCYVQQAPVDLLKEMRENGLSLDPHVMHFEVFGLYPYYNFMKADSAKSMGGLHAAMHGALKHSSDFYLGVGAPDDPFVHVIKPPKVLHPKIQAYADHAKAMSDGWAKADAKKLFTAKGLKSLKNAHHSWA